MKKRILAMLLAILMVISNISVSTYAADIEEGAKVQVCAKCAAADCTSDHINWCDVCKIDDCGKNHCPLCGTINCTKEHKTCSKCGTMDCTSSHANWCYACKIDDCGKNHCPVCGTVNCTEKHKACDKCGSMTCTSDHINWCTLCKIDDCGKNHCPVCGTVNCVHMTSRAPVKSTGKSVDHSGDVNKYVKLNEAVTTFAVYGLYSTGTLDTQTFMHEDFQTGTIFQIAEWMTKDGDLWYRLTFYKGGLNSNSSFALDFPAEPWFKQTTANELVFLDTCSTCGKPDCSGHTWCDICEKYDCGKDHTQPEKPGIFDTVTDSAGREYEVTVTGDALTEGVTLEAKQLDVTEIPDFPWEMYGLTSENYTLDLTLWNGSEKWQPDAPVEVSVPAQLLGFSEGTRFVALHRHVESNGETYMEPLGPYYVKDGFATVTMDEFSTITYISKDKSMRIDGVGAFFRAYSAWTGNHNYTAVGVYADTDGNIHILMEGVSNNTPHKDLDYVTIVHNPKDDKADWQITKIEDPSSQVVSKVSVVNAYNADGELVGHLTPTGGAQNTWYWDINLGPIEIKGDFGIVVKTTVGQEGNSFNTGETDTGGQPVEIRIFYDIQKTVYAIGGDTDKSGDDVVLDQDDKGKEVIYQIVVSNLDSSETDLQGIIVTDILPDIFQNGSIYVGTSVSNMAAATVTEGKLTLATDLILAPGYDQTYYVKGTLKDDLPVGMHENIATISGKLVEGDSDPSGIIVPPAQFGSLKISKTVEVPQGADYAAPEQNFTFTVTFADTVTEFGYQVFETGSGADTYIRSGAVKSGGTLELAHNQYAVIDHVTPGAYTVTETAAENFVANQTTYSGTILNQQQAVANYVNTYTLPQGDLLIAKFVEYGEYAPADTDREFEFKVTLPVTTGGSNFYRYDIMSYGDGPIPSPQDELVTSGRLELDLTSSGTFKLKHRQYIRIKNVLIGDYTLTELLDDDAYETPMYYYDNNSVLAYTTTGKIIGGKINQVMCYNYPMKYPGDLAITKNVEVLNELAQAPVQEFVFEVLLTNVPNLDNYGTNPAADDEGVLEEEIRKYHVTYTAAEGKGTLSGYQYTLNGETVTLQETVDLLPGVDGYTFTISLYDGLTATIEDLPPCGYDVSEMDYSEQSFTAEWSEGKTGLLGGPEGSVASVTCTNTYGVTTGDLQIRKNVKKAYERDTIPACDFDFTVIPSEGITLDGSYDLYIGETKVGTAVAQNNRLQVNIPFTADEVDIVLNDAAIKTLTIKGVPMGAYTVTEASDDDFDLIDSTPNATVRTVPGLAIFTNEYRRHLGRITINKVTVGGSSSDTFVFNISGNGVNMDVTVPANQSVTIFDLPMGTYTVTEDTDWSWRYEANTTSQTVTLVLGPQSSTGMSQDKAVTFTNTYSKNQWLNYVINVLNEFRASNN